jgi:hypothetical protein
MYGTPLPWGSWVFVNTPDWITLAGVEIHGKLVDAGGCGLEGAAVTLSSSESADSIITSLTTDSDGEFSTTFTPAGAAGNHVIKVTAGSVNASLTVPVHPHFDSMDHLLGGVAGGQSVTLAGLGFSASNAKVLFNGKPWTTSINVWPDKIVLVTPPSPTGKAMTGEILVQINGVDSLPLPYEYQYVVPGQPLLTFTSQTCNGTTSAWLAVDDFDSDGKTIPG